MDSMLSPGSIAALVPCSTHAVLRAEKNGTIPAALRTPGGHRRWPSSALETIQLALRCRAATRDGHGGEPSATLPERIAVSA